MLQQDHFLVFLTGIEKGYQKTWHVIKLKLKRGEKNLTQSLLLSLNEDITLDDIIG